MIKQQDNQVWFQFAPKLSEACVLSGVLEVECSTLWVRQQKSFCRRNCCVSVERHRFCHWQIAADVVHCRQQAARQQPSTEELALLYFGKAQCECMSTPKMCSNIFWTLYESYSKLILLKSKSPSHKASILYWALPKYDNSWWFTMYLALCRIFLFYCYNVYFCICLDLSHIMHVFCIVLSIISILYFSIYIHVIFSYSAF